MGRAPGGFCIPEGISIEEIHGHDPIGKNSLGVHPNTPPAWSATSPACEVSLLGTVVMPRVELAKRSVNRSIFGTSSGRKQGSRRGAESQNSR